MLLLLAGVACTPAGEEAEPIPTTTVEVPVTAPPTDASTSSTSPLGDLVQPLGSARYDPDEHRRDQRAPVALSLPALGVTAAPVRAVGVEPNGEMEIPPAEEVGWYRYGPAPGEAGSVVLAAHVAYDGVDGVFRELDRLQTGDEVIVALDDGSEARYRVTEVVTYRKEALPADIFDREGPERLVLITCGGRFNPSLRSYESNVVARAVPA